MTEILNEFSLELLCELACEGELKCCLYTRNLKDFDYIRRQCKESGLVLKLTVPCPTDDVPEYEIKISWKKAFGPKPFCFMDDKINDLIDLVQFPDIEIPTEMSFAQELYITAMRAKAAEEELY